ncbi:MAG TPA: type II toxin-antitoxin system VapC family toxin [Micropepsaceae bacterium]|nr:type II toxin-antitoxin system VapC family toxin [Micropepsaceae bacterium]
MLAVDTNLIVRYLVADDQEQAARARTLINENDVFVTVTVALEVEWVLRSAYGYSTAQFIAAFTALSGLPGVSIEDVNAVRTALEWSRIGVDFADGLHLARSQHCDAFITFDRGLTRDANRLGALKVRAP